MKGKDTASHFICICDTLIVLLNNKMTLCNFSVKCVVILNRFSDVVWHWLLVMLMLFKASFSRSLQSSEHKTDVIRNFA